MNPFPCSRREMLRRSAGGIGGLALAGMLADEARAVAGLAAGPLSPKPAHHAARAKSVIFLYMTGGVSHIESFDYKPKLFARRSPLSTGAKRPASTSATSSSLTGTSRRAARAASA